MTLQVALMVNDFVVGLCLLVLTLLMTGSVAVDGAICIVCPTSNVGPYSTATSSFSGGNCDTPWSDAPEAATTMTKIKKKTRIHTITVLANSLSFSCASSFFFFSSSATASSLSISRASLGTG